MRFAPRSLAATAGAFAALAMAHTLVGCTSRALPIDTDSYPPAPFPVITDMGSDASVRGDVTSVSDRPLPRDVLQRDADLGGRTDGPETPDGPRPSQQVGFQFTTLTISQPGPDQHSDFMRVFNTIVPLLQSGAVAAPLIILVRFSAVDFGAATVVTFCQGELNQQNGNGYDCLAGGAESTTTGVLDRSGNLTTDPADLAFAVTSSIGTFGFTLRDFTITGGVLDPQASNGAGATPGTLINGSFTAALDTRDLCGMPSIDNATVAGALNCPNPISFADMLDGPLEMCGQDASAEPVPCTFSTDTGTHNPPTADGLFPLVGNFELAGATYVQ
jgi:hypothetical protein